MKRKFFSKALAIFMVLALIMSFAAISVSAEGEDEGPETPTETETETLTASTTFAKNLVIAADANVPQITFNFTINAGQARAVSGSNLEILAGVFTTVTNADESTTVYPFVNPAVFTGNEDTTEGTPTGADSTKKYATVNPVIDFSGVQFTVPGIYRYQIEEVNSASGKGITNDASSRRYLDVYVVRNESDELVVSNYVLRSSATDVTRGEDGKAAYASNPDEKSAGYTNKIDSYDVTFSKKIAGNQSDPNKRFEFTVNLSNLLPGKYSVTGTDFIVDNANNTATDKATIEVTDTGSVTKTFFLTNNSNVVIHGLNSGATYNISENSQDYIAAVTNTGGTVSGSAWTGSLTDSNASAEFTNTRDGVIPTGVLLTIAPFAIGLLLFGAVAFFLISKKRREDY